MRILAFLLVLMPAVAFAQLPPGGPSITDGTTIVPSPNTLKFTSGCVVSNGGQGTANAACGASGGTNVGSVATYALLRSSVNPTANAVVCTSGFAAAGDYGGGCYTWKAGDARTPDGTFLVSSTFSGAPAGNWVLTIPATGLHPQIAGAKCDYNMVTGTGTDDHVALQNLISRYQASSNISNGASNGNGEIVQVPGTSCYNGTSNLTGGRGVMLVGVGNPFSATGGNPGAFSPFLVLAPTTSFVCSASTGIRDAVIWRYGLAQKVTTFEQAFTYSNTTIQDSSIAISNNASDCVVKNVTVIGFNKDMYSTGGARTFVDDLQGDGANCLEITNYADSNAGRIAIHCYPYYTFSVNGHMGAYGFNVVNAGQGAEINGELLTITNVFGTQVTAATCNAVVSAGNLTGCTLNDTGDYTASPQTYGLTATPTIAYGAATTGTGCAATSTFNLTVAAGTVAPGGSAATVNVTTNGGGQITTINSYTPGAYTVAGQPSPINAATGSTCSKVSLALTVGKNPLAVTGAVGTVTLTMNQVDSGYRPGTCLNLHDQADGINVAYAECEEYQTSASLSNIWNADLHRIGGEGGYNNADKQPVAIQTANCVSDVHIDAPQADAQWKDLVLNHVSSANGGSCGGASNSGASITITNGHLGFNFGVTQCAVCTGSGSTGILTGITEGWGGHGLGWPAAVQIGAGSGQWLIDHWQFDFTTPTQQQFSEWISVSGTATPPISAQFAFDGQSLLINGDFAIDQANEGAGVTTGNALTVDRWRRQNQGGPTATVQRITGDVPGFFHSLKLSSGAANSIASGSANGISQQIETVSSTDYLQWGAPLAQPIVAAGTIEASQTGTFGVYLLNAGQSTSLVHGCVVAAANTPTPCAFVVPGPTIATWTGAAGSTAFFFGFDSGSGSTLQTGTPDTWAAVKYFSGTGYVQTLATNGATVTYTGWHLYPGPFLKPVYTPPSYGTELERAQRFYQKSFSAGTAPAQNAGTAGASSMPLTVTTVAPGTQERFATPMIVAPTVTFYNTSATNANCRDATAGADLGAASAVNTGTSGFYVKCALAGSPAAGDTAQVQWSADSGL